MPEKERTMQGIPYYYAAIKKLRSYLLQDYMRTVSFVSSAKDWQMEESLRCLYNSTSSSDTIMADTLGHDYAHATPPDKRIHLVSWIHLHIISGT